jgi:hypothetical protein
MFFLKIYLCELNLEQLKIYYWEKNAGEAGLIKIYGYRIGENAIYYISE